MNEPKQRQRMARIFFALYLGLLLAPGAVIFWLQWPDLGSISRLGLPYSLFFLAFWFALFARRLWLGGLLLAPFAVLTAPYVYYLIRYQSQPKVAVIGTLFETSKAEALGFLDNDLLPLAVCIVIMLVITVVALVLAYRACLQWRSRVRYWVIGLFVLIMVVPPTLNVVRKPQRPPKYPTVWHTIQHEAKHAGTRVERTYPFGALFPLVEYAHYKRAMQKNLKVLADYRFDAALATPTNERQVYVLVLGESSRPDHWQLFGYERATTPHLMQQDNLVLLPDMVSSFPQTRKALPIILTRKAATDDPDKPWPEASIVRAMSEAGFDTWWVSNQKAIGPHDSSVAIHSHEADRALWLDSLNNGWDEALATSLKQALAQSQNHLFVVLHMTGSHENYDDSYPDDFVTFKPVLRNRNTQVPKWERAQNSYDNTIVYTDHVLAKIIGTLEQQNTIAAMWYISDHGEVLRSETCEKHGHGHQTYHEFTVPALMWYSDAYRQRFPQRVDVLQRHAHEKTMSQNVFPTLVDMAGLTIPDYAAKQEWSLMSTGWQPHTRWVGQFDMLNFDSAEISGACMDMQPIN